MARKLPYLWFAAAAIWMLAGMWADAYIMGSGVFIPKGWIMVWYGPPLFFTLKLIVFGGTAALALRGLYLYTR